VTNDDCKHVLKKIIRMWPGKFEVTDPEMVPDWAEAMGSVTLDEALNAVQALARTSKWVPGVRDIREVVADRRGLLAPDAEVALPQMREWVFYQEQRRHVNGSGFTPAKPKVHPAVRSGFARMGGDWESGFRFEWPKIKAEYDDKILGGST
jgi:hypothetical protein